MVIIGDAIEDGQQAAPFQPQHQPSLFPPSVDPVLANAGAGFTGLGLGPGVAGPGPGSASLADSGCSAGDVASIKQGGEGGGGFLSPPSPSPPLAPLANEPGGGGFKAGEDPMVSTGLLKALIGDGQAPSAQAQEGAGGACGGAPGGCAGLGCVARLVSVNV